VRRGIHAASVIAFLETLKQLKTPRSGSEGKARMVSEFSHRG
jgi:hypothetical protein